MNWSPTTTEISAVRLAHFRQTARRGLAKARAERLTAIERKGETK